MSPPRGDLGIPPSRAADHGACAEDQQRLPRGDQDEQRDADCGKPYSPEAQDDAPLGLAWEQTQGHDNGRDHEGELDQGFHGHRTEQAAFQGVPV
jgi:hypothetical protein